MLRKSFSYEYGIQILHVREANQFVHRGIVADVSFQVGMRIAPFEGSEAEHGNVQHIGFAGVDAGSLLWCDFCRDKVLFDSIGVDAVIYFRQFSLGTPAQLREFLLLKALELAD